MTAGKASSGATGSCKHLFSRALAAAPGRLHFAAHSHHLWPNASFDGQMTCWNDAARLAHRKWSHVMGELWPAAQRHVAAELHLPDPATVAFASNMHDFLIRIVSAFPRRPLRVLASDGEFHSFQRQAARWVEAGAIRLETVPAEGGDFADRFLSRAQPGEHDLVWVSQVMFASGLVFADFDRLAELGRPEGPWIVVDGYHGFMAIESDLAPARAPPTGSHRRLTPVAAWPTLAFATARHKLAQPVPLIVPKHLAFHARLQKPVLNQNSSRLGIPKMSLQPRSIAPSFLHPA